MSSKYIWSLLERLLLGRSGSRGRLAHDNRRFINAVFWILRTGAPWRDLPPSYGDWKNTHRRFCRWRDKGVWNAHGMPLGVFITDASTADCQKASCLMKGHWCWELTGRSRL